MNALTFRATKCSSLRTNCWRILTFRVLPACLIAEPILILSNNMISFPINFCWAPGFWSIVWVYRTSVVCVSIPFKRKNASLKRIWATVCLALLICLLYTKMRVKKTFWEIISELEHRNLLMQNFPQSRPWNIPCSDHNNISLLGPTLINPMIKTMKSLISKIIIFFQV